MALNSRRKALEVGSIDAFVGLFPRSPLQRNGPHESDSEILELGAGAGYLAVKADAVVEEIEEGLYASGFEIGWVAAVAPLSDLAAVGAEPLGILVQTTFDPSRGEDFRLEVARGVRLACERAGTFVLGGDTNAGRSTWVGGIAVGRIPPGPLLRRVGARAGDRIFLSGPAGAGNAFAARRLLGPAGSGSSPFMPEPRLALGRALLGLASAAIDTSDGFVAALDEVLRLNGLGAELSGEPLDWLCAEAREVASAPGFGAWPLLAGQHGEFELLFTVSPERIGALERAACAVGARPVEVGRLIEGADLCWLPRPGHRIPIDSCAARDLSRIAEVSSYVRSLLALTAAWERAR